MTKLQFPAHLDKDEEFKQIAFDEYKLAHGFGDQIRLGDMPLKVVSEVLGKAQALKQRFQESH